MPVSAENPPAAAAGTNAKDLVPGCSDTAGAERDTGRSAGRGANTTMPSAPAIKKSTVSSLSTMIVTAQESAKKSQAIQSLRNVFRPRFQHALTIRETTTGPMP